MEEYMRLRQLMELAKKNADNLLQVTRDFLDAHIIAFDTMADHDISLPEARKAFIDRMTERYDAFIESKCSTTE